MRGFDKCSLVAMQANDYEYEEVLQEGFGSVCISCVCVCAHAHVCSVVSDSLQPHKL